VSVAGLPAGTYNWRVKSGQIGSSPSEYNTGYLAVDGTLVLAGLPVTSVDMGMLSDGDCNGDNRVTAPDFVIMANSFGRSPGQPNYDNRADINGDNRVTVTDYNELRRNFGFAGAPPIGP
jgi:hypothetical protein